MEQYNVYPVDDGVMFRVNVWWNSRSSAALAFAGPLPL